MPVHRRRPGIPREIGGAQNNQPNLHCRARGGRVRAVSAYNIRHVPPEAEKRQFSGIPLPRAHPSITETV